MNLKFKNGKFTIMQVSDPQDLQYTRGTMIRMLNSAYDQFKPDLVVFTGDNILGNHLHDARLLTKYKVKDKASEGEAMKTAIDHICSPLEKRKIPFAMIYGNHDDMNLHTKDEQAEFYRQYKYNLGLDDPDSPDVATYNLPIYSEDGSKIKFNIWMMDSAWKDKELDKCFTDVKAEAVEWYKNKSKKLTAENGGKAVPSIMFQHVPMQEIMELVDVLDEKVEGSIEGVGPLEGKFLKLKNGVTGELGEQPSFVTNKVGQFEAIKECGDVKAVVTGHDHHNGFEGEFNGIKFIQTPAASFRCYGHENRGVRIFTVDEATGDFTTKHYTYKDICGNGILQKLSYIWDADDMVKQKIGLIAGAVSAVVVIIAVLIALF
ncbi:MAG: metallophosphoesterase [Oscillospiraceae bacterium]|nr:metallophosphoesterase [Oscillospiraceae bacterium]